MGKVSFKLTQAQIEEIETAVEERIEYLAEQIEGAALLGAHGKGDAFGADYATTCARSLHRLYSVRASLMTRVEPPSPEGRYPWEE